MPQRQVLETVNNDWGKKDYSSLAKFSVLKHYHPQEKII